MRERIYPRGRTKRHDRETRTRRAFMLVKSSCSSRPRTLVRPLCSSRSSCHSFRVVSCRFVDKSFHPAKEPLPAKVPSAEVHLIVLESLFVAAQEAIPVGLLGSAASAEREEAAAAATEKV